MTINQMDAQEISKGTADTFRTKVSHMRENLTTAEYEAVRDLCMTILDGRLDNSMIQHKTIDPISGEVTDHGK